jgi:hypothetical protein
MQSLIELVLLFVTLLKGDFSIYSYLTRIVNFVDGEIEYPEVLGTTTAENANNRSRRKGIARDSGSQ